MVDLKPRQGARRKSPLSWDNVVAICELHVAAPVGSCRRAASAAFVVSLFTALRSDNLVPKKAKDFDHERQLCWGNMVWIMEENAYSVKFKKHKSSRRGVLDTRIPDFEQQNLSPVRMLRNLKDELVILQTESCFMYKDRSGNRKTLTYAVLSKELHSWEDGLGLDKGSLTPHVGRITSATEAEILALGFWSDPKTAQSYVRLSGRDINSVQRKVISKHLGKS